MKNKKSICPKCQGKGKVFDHEAGLFTFGMDYFFQLFDKFYKKKCDVCNGKKFLILKK